MNMRVKSGAALAAAAFVIAAAATFAGPSLAAMTAKGQGFINVSAKTCAAKHGKVIG